MGKYYDELLRVLGFFEPGKGMSEELYRKGEKEFDRIFDEATKQGFKAGFTKAVDVFEKALAILRKERV
jgi:hypothetical protein